MKRNLTLAIDDEVLQRARLAAVRRRQSLTSLIRGFLERLAGSHQRRGRAVRRLEKAMANPPLKVGSQRWTREELHERPRLS